VNKLLGLHAPFTVHIKLKSDTNNVQYKALSKAAADRLTDVKQVRSRNFARTLEVSSVQNSRNA
jgi:phosphoribosylformylglycinamidine (FGAM) synthase PurS component